MKSSKDTRNTSLSLLVSVTLLGASIFAAPPAQAVAPSNDDFDTPTVIGALPFTETVDTSEATTAPDDPPCVGNDGSTVWYSFTAAQDIRIDVDTFGSDYDTTLGAYTGSRGSLTLLDCNDQANDGNQSRIRIDLIAGELVFLMIGSWQNSAGGALILNVDVAPPPPPPPPNDEIDGATVLAGLPFTETVSTNAATRAIDDPSCSEDQFFIENSYTLWWTFTPSEDTRIAFDSRGGDVDSILAAFAGPPGSLTTLEGSCRRGRIVVSASAGETVYLLAEDFIPAEGSDLLRITADLGPPPIANDDIEAATVIDTLPFADSLDASLATRADDDPPSACESDPFDSTVWYVLTPEADMRLDIGVGESGYGATILAYAGTPGSLSPLACNSPRLLIDVESGQTIYLMIAGHAGIDAQLALVVDLAPAPPANDDFDSATEIGVPPFIDEVDLAGASRSDDDPQCGPASSSSFTVWYAMTATEDVYVRARVDHADFDEFSVSAYSGSRGSLVALACDWASFERSPRVRVDVPAGETVLFMVGGHPGPDGHVTVSIEAVPRIDEFAMPRPDAAINPNWLTGGPDGNLWFTDGGAIGRTSPTGDTTVFQLEPQGITEANHITPGPLGRLWFTARSTEGFGEEVLASITVDGEAEILASVAGSWDVAAGPDDVLWVTATNTETPLYRVSLDGVAVPVPLPDEAELDQVTAGPDGNAWFTGFWGSQPAMIRVTPDGEADGFPIPGARTTTYLAPGPDGNVWFEAQGGSAGGGGYRDSFIGFVTPEGAVTTFEFPRDFVTVSGIVAGPDGNIWFPLRDDRIGRVTPSGVFAEFDAGGEGVAPYHIASGSDGNVWYLGGSPVSIYRMDPGGAATVFPLPLGRLPLSPLDITTGPDGALWFTLTDSDQLGRITTAGDISTIDLPEGSHPIGVASGSDGNLWVTLAYFGEIAKVTPGGVITRFPIPTQGSYPYYITAGPDGNLWFVEQHRELVGGEFVILPGSKVARITTGGRIREFEVAPSTNLMLTDITSGTDGALWFTGAGRTYGSSRCNIIGRITPFGRMTKHWFCGDRDPVGITSGPDRAMWFTIYQGGGIGRIDRYGHRRFFALPSGAHPWEITKGPEGALWFTDERNDEDSNVGRITTRGNVTYFDPPSSFSLPQGIVTGPDGNVWFTQTFADAVARLTPLRTCRWRC